MMLASVFRMLLFAVAGLWCVTTIALADPIVTRLNGSPGHWQLLRDGQPYFIKGVGGNGPLTLLKDLGGNSVRTWGADDLGPQLDQAQQLGISVCVGIWLGHEDKNNHFNYSDPKQVATQFARAKAAILKYKDNPAVLMWGIGNEMEGNPGDKEQIWKAVNDIAKMAKQLDPNHPTMTVVAEIGGDAIKVKAIQKYCPDIDIIGINSYGGAASVYQRYQASGVTKPYVLTEYGPIGFWEGGHTSFGAAIEPNSTEKAGMYATAYANAIAGAPGTCLGGYAFLWGHKEEMTPTWFGMLLEDRSKTGAVAAVATQWTGHAPDVLPPTIKPIQLDGGDHLKTGQTIKASVEAASPSQRPLQITWELRHETEVHGEGGSYEPPTKQYADAIVAHDGGNVTVKIPDEPGVYRLYVTARDDKDNAATANVPLQVVSDKPTAGGLKQPVVIYGDDAPDSGYVPSGWMGNTKAIALDPKSTNDPHTGATCMECKYTAGDNFGGVVWQSPVNNWGDQPGGRDLTGAKTLTVWARGAKGGEKVEFKFGVLNADQKHKDTASGDTTVTLTPDWKKYEIDLDGKDLSDILTGFCWVTAGQGDPVTFYLDDIAFE